MVGESHERASYYCFCLYATGPLEEADPGLLWADGSFRTFRHSGILPCLVGASPLLLHGTIFLLARN